MSQDQRLKKHPSSGASGSPKSPNTSLILAAITVVAILGIALFAIFMTSGGQSTSFTPDNQGLLPVGSQAPNFNARTIDGRNISLSSAEGKGAIMLVLFASWCPHCQKEAPIISGLEQKYGDKLQVVMLGVDGRDNADTVREFVQKYKIKGPAVYDPSLASTFQVKAYPTVYILNSSGKIVAANQGETPQGVYEGWIKEAL